MVADFDNFVYTKKFYSCTASLGSCNDRLASLAQKMGIVSFRFVQDQEDAEKMKKVLSCAFERFNHFAKKINQVKVKVKK